MLQTLELTELFVKKNENIAHFVLQHVCTANPLGIELGCNLDPKCARLQFEPKKTLPNVCTIQGYKNN